MCIRYSMPLYINHPYLSLRYRLPPCSDICGSLQLGLRIEFHWHALQQHLSANLLTLTAVVHFYIQLLVCVLYSLFCGILYNATVTVDYYNIALDVELYIYITGCLSNLNREWAGIPTHYLYTW